MSLQIHEQTYINVEKKSKNKILDKLPKKVCYRVDDSSLLYPYKGRGIKIVVVDSGCPKHKDIKIEGEKVSFCDNKNVYDKMGHSTMVTGVLNANNKNTIIGVAPDAQVYFAKAVNDSGKCNFNALIASILWAIVKEADIIMMTLGSQYNYSVLHDAIKKAYKANICIVASAGNGVKNENVEPDFPARYPEVVSVGMLPRFKKQRNRVLLKVNVALSNEKIYTTYPDNRYIEATGSSMATAFVVGRTALIIEKLKLEKKVENTPHYIYTQLMKAVK